MQYARAIKLWWNSKQQNGDDGGCDDEDGGCKKVLTERKTFVFAIFVLALVFVMRVADAAAATAIFSLFRRM